MKKGAYFKIFIIMLSVLLLSVCASSVYGHTKLVNANTTEFFDESGKKIELTEQNMPYIRLAKEEIWFIEENGLKIILNINEKLQSEIDGTSIVLDAQTGKVLACNIGENAETESGFVEKINSFGRALESGNLSINSIIKTKDGDHVLKNYLKEKNITEKTNLFELARTAAAVCNKGFDVEPYLVQKVFLNGEIIYETEPCRTQIMSDDTAFLLAYSFGENFEENGTKIVLGGKNVGVFEDSEKNLKINKGGVTVPETVGAFDIDLIEFDSSGKLIQAQAQLKNEHKAKMYFAKRFAPPHSTVKKVEEPVLKVSAIKDIAKIVIETKKHYEIELFKNKELIKTLNGKSRYEIEEQIEAGVENVFEAVAKHGSEVSAKKAKSVFVGKEISKLSSEEAAGIFSKQFLYHPKYR